MEKDCIYIIEDDEGIREVYGGAFDGIYETEMFADAASFFAAFAERRPSLVIVDLMLPDMDGYEILTRIRARDERLPVIIVSAKSDEISSVKGLNKGADDYISKPFSVMDLQARVKAGLRRAKLYVSHQAEFAVDNANFTASFRGKDLGLTLKEFRILRCLLSRAGTTVSREELFREAWGTDFLGETRALDMHVAQIREKIRLAGGETPVKTVRGIGYRIETL